MPQVSLVTTKIYLDMFSLVKCAIYMLLWMAHFFWINCQRNSSITFFTASKIWPVIHFKYYLKVIPNVLSVASMQMLAVCNIYIHICIYHMGLYIVSIKMIRVVLGNYMKKKILPSKCLATQICPSCTQTFKIKQNLGTVCRHLAAERGHISRASERDRPNLTLPRW